MTTPIKYINREITWLKFNARVLQEARDKTVPLLDRLRFLGIYSNNLDEFYKVRYATVLRALELDSAAYNNIIEGQSLKKLLSEIREVVALQQDNYDRTFQEIIRQLEDEDIYFIDEHQLEEEHIAYIKKLYQEKLSHTTAVFLWKPDQERIPSFREDAYYLAVKMTKFSKNLNEDIVNYSIIEVPTYIFSRFIVLPSKENKKYFMMLEDAIRYNLDEIFEIFDYDHIEAHSIKSSKDAELDLDQDVQRSFMDRIARSVERRRSGEPVRLVYDKDMAPDTFEYVKNIMHIDKYDSVSPGSKYHNKRDFIGFPDLGRAELNNAAIQPLTPPALVGVKSYIKAIEQQDHMLHAPYTDYSIFLKFLRECAIDPKVKAIKMTVYRVANQSQIMSALVNAVRNGKEVTAVLELRARFDEANNVNWSKILQDEGVQVIFGVADLKVHSKIGVVTYTDEENEENLKKIAFISTGNFHEKTARIYTDFTLLTSHKEIATEIDEVFDFFQANYKVKDYKHLILSPFSTRRRIYELIDQEIENQKKGLPAQINIKINSLSDKGMIDKLYEANDAGVEVRLVVRGICCLIPGKYGLSENIKAISVVDKFLEHPRVFWFKNAGKDKIYISSADLMARNIDHRVEMTCPIYDPILQEEIMDTFELSFNDNVKGRIQNATLDEIYQENDLAPNRSQVSIYEYYKKRYNEDN
ncbi:polyphosphate kinase 1 [Weeksellaceae bacterium KMM 9713]|uniref:Polyphosphate kinase n=1 Tax=Profundicola chukchiensis TaxID=2961959 RepID=A0A9X4MZT8_9FLAO|nr:polyphosphate kinase 1 [Profundicola chukchiensis]MDG4946705.1 polyphosphate kinase 1 [Profundicola chukchiensis]